MVETPDPLRAALILSPRNREGEERLIDALRSTFGANTVTVYSGGVRINPKGAAEVFGRADVSAAALRGRASARAFAVAQERALRSRERAARCFLAARAGLRRVSATLSRQACDSVPFHAERTGTQAAVAASL